jgi:outer membrane protein
MASSNITRRMMTLAGLTALGWTGTSLAQSLPQQQDQEQPRAKKEFNLGLGVAYVPTFQGADGYRMVPLPSIDISIGRFFVNLRNGVGLKVVETRNVTLGASLSWTPGYRGRDVPDGIGRLSTGLGARAFGSLSGGGFIATLGATQGLAGGTGGLIADASLSRPVMLTRQLFVIPTVGITWANEQHQDRYFGINASQALASGLPEYHLDPGSKDASASITLNYRMTPRLNLTLSGGSTVLLGDAKDSPLVEDDTTFSAFFAFSYRFGR